MIVFVCVVVRVWCELCGVWMCGGCVLYVLVYVVCCVWLVW